MNICFRNSEKSNPDATIYKASRDGSQESLLNISHQNIGGKKMSGRWGCRPLVGMG